jgi:hypothetical protein
VNDNVGVRPWDLDIAGVFFMRMGRLFVSGALLMMLGACRQEPKPVEPPVEEVPPLVEVPPVVEVPPTAPFLSDTPLWKLEAPESLRET